MFGYVTIHKPELKIKDFNEYQAYYCGLCHSLKEQFGMIGQATLTYDMTFLIILLTSLYEKKPVVYKERCILHPTKKHAALINEYTEYAACMNVVFGYFHLLDNWKDEKQYKSLVGAKALEKAYQKVKKKYPEKCSIIATKLKQLRAYEQRKITNIDEVANCFGEIMSEVLIVKDDEWAFHLRRMGLLLGKFIYLMDAYDDLEKDEASESYNVLSFYREEENFHSFSKELLTMYIAECAREFECLPIILHQDILRNILYAGVWQKYNQKQKAKEGREDDR